MNIILKLAFVLWYSGRYTRQSTWWFEEPASDIDIVRTLNTIRYCHTRSVQIAHKHAQLSQGFLFNGMHRSITSFQPIHDKSNMRTMEMTPSNICTHKFYILIFSYVRYNMYIIQKVTNHNIISSYSHLGTQILQINTDIRYPK